MRLPFYIISIATLSLLGCKPVARHAVMSIGTDTSHDHESIIAIPSAKVDHRPGNAPAEVQIKMPGMPHVQTTMRPPSLPDFDKMPQADHRSFNNHELTQPTDGKFSQLPHGVPPLPSGVGNPLEHRLPELPGAPYGQPGQTSGLEPQGIPYGVPDVTMFKPGNIGLTGIPHGVAPIVPNLGIHAVQALGTQDKPAWKEQPKSISQAPATINSPAGSQ